MTPVSRYYCVHSASFITWDRSMSHSAILRIYCHLRASYSIPQCQSVYEVAALHRVNPRTHQTQRTAKLNLFLMVLWLIQIFHRPQFGGKLLCYQVQIQTSFCCDDFMVILLPYNTILLLISLNLFYGEHARHTIMYYVSMYICNKTFKYVQVCVLMNKSNHHTEHLCKQRNKCLD